MKRKTGLILATTISAAFAVLTFSQMTLAGDRYSEDGNIKAYLSPMEPIRCMSSRKTVVCTVDTARPYTNAMLALTARKAMNFVRPKIIKVVDGLYDLRDFDSETGVLRHMYIATPAKYQEMK